MIGQVINIFLLILQEKKDRDGKTSIAFSLEPCSTTLNAVLIAIVEPLSILTHFGHFSWCQAVVLVLFRHQRRLSFSALCVIRFIPCRRDSPSIWRHTAQKNRTCVIKWVMKVVNVSILSDLVHNMSSCHCFHSVANPSRNGTHSKCTYWPTSRVWETAGHDWALLFQHFTAHSW